MTTAYTSLLGLALPVTGELNGVWGDTVNDSITSLLDSAVAGTTTISSDADVTLTTTTGASNTSRQAIILWTAGGTVTRNITAPAQSKIYTVINKSSSTQSIVLRGAGPTTGVTIVQGESAVCAWNGSDFIKISNTAGSGTFTNLTVTGNTSLGDADTDTITQAASYVTGTQLKSAKTATNTLSLAAYDVDGTAYTNLITLTAGNTPTLALTSTGVGTINNMSIGATTASTGAFTTLSASGAVTLSGGTENGVAYLNGSKVLTTGSALSFDGNTFAVASSDSRFNVTSTGSGQTAGISIKGGAGGGSDYNFIESLNSTGTQQWYLGGNGTANVLAFKVATVEGFRLTSTSLYTASTINVGIGTSSPLAKLNVSGGTTIASLAEWNSKANTVFTLANAAVRLGVGYDANDQPLIQGFDSTNGARPIGLQVYGGNVGIGTSSPTAKLTVSGNQSFVEKTAAYLGVDVATSAGNGGNLTVKAGAGNGAGNTAGTLYLGAGRGNASASNGSIVFGIAQATNTVGLDSTLMTLDSSGNLGVGVTPSAIFTDYKGIQLYNATGMGMYGSGYGATVTSNAYPSATGSVYTRGGNSYRPTKYSAFDGAHTWSYAAAAGTTISWTDAMTLDASGNLLVGTTSTTPTNGGVVSLFGGGESYLNIGHKTGAASGAYYLAGFYNGTLVGGLTQVGTTGIVLTSISDYRLKENVLPMQDSLNKILALSPVSYKWKSDGSDGEGFIAHELQAVIPTATTGKKDEVDQEGNAKYQGINLSALVPHLVKAIQELKAEFDAYKASHP